MRERITQGGLLNPPVKETPAERSAAIEKQTQEFLARGGEIQKLGTFINGTDPTLTFIVNRKAKAKRDYALSERSRLANKQRAEEAAKQREEKKHG